MTQNQAPVRKRRKRTKRQYFTKIHEEAILEYCSTEDYKRKNELYETLIQKAFHEMVEKIVATYKFNTLPNIEELKDECKIWLVTILQKYDKDRGSKAFSYFSVITKNWFIHKVKKNNKARSREVDYDELPKIHSGMIADKSAEDHLVTENTYLADREQQEFWMAFYREMNSWSTMRMTEQEEKVYKAVKILMENPEDIEIFNKKAIYLYLRELTGLNTKQVVSSLAKLRSKYKTFKKNII